MRTIPLLLVFTLVLAGCMTTGSAASHHGQVALDWGIIGLPDVPTLDPALASDPTSISVASLVYGGLVRLDSSLHVRPDGASHWTISRDGLTYTFYLRPNLRFPSGRRVTASDFAASLQRALGPEGATGTAPFYLGLIQQHTAIVSGGTRTKWGIAALNPTTLRITLTRPAAHFLTELAFPASFVPDPTLFTRYGQDWTEHAAGFGPYFVQAWHHSRSLTLQRNPYYYGGRPPLHTVTLHFYGGDRNAIRAYSRGDLDLLSGWQAGETTTGPVGIRRVPALALDYLAFNAARPPFRHLNARRALAMASTPTLIRRAMGATAFPAQSYIPSAFGIPVRRWKGSGSAPAYLARAGYPRGKGFPSVALVIPRDPHLAALGNALSAAWSRELGIDIRVRALNSKDYGAVLDAHAFDIALVRWGGDYPDPQDFLGTQLGSSPDNVTRWTGRAYVDDVEIADSYHPNDPRRTALFRSAALLAQRKLPLVPLDEPAVTAVVRPGLQGVSVTPLGTIVGDWAHAGFKD